METEDMNEDVRPRMRDEAGGMEPQREAAMRKASHSTHSLLKLLAILVGLIVLVGGWKLFTESGLYGEGIEWEYAPPPADMTGWLYMNLNPLPLEQRELALDLYPYIYSFADEEFFYTETDFLGEEIANTLFHTFSPGDLWAAFIAAPYSVYETDDDWEFFTADQVYRADLRDEEALEYEQLIAAEAVTDKASFDKRFVAISDKGEIVYASLTDEQSLPNYDEFPREVERWMIYHIGLDGSERALTTGYAPRFTGDNHFFFLKNDGIYVYSLGTGEEERVWESAQIPMHENDMIDVSDDGHYVALVQPDANSLRILKTGEVSSESPLADFALQSVHEISVAASWPVISPEALYVAVQIANWDMLADSQNRIEFYRIDTGERANFAINLADMDPLVIQIVDWRP